MAQSLVLPPATRTASAPGIVRAQPGVAALDVLLLDGQQRQTLACARAYGRAGRRVGVTACAGDESAASALHSRWCSVAASLPDVSADRDAFVDALLALLGAYPSEVILPAHDGSIEALRARRAEIERHAAVAIAPEAALEIAVDKPKTLALARRLGIATPRSVMIRAAADLQPALTEVGLPAMLKPVRSWTADGERGARVLGLVVQDHEDALLGWDYLHAFGGDAQVQEWVPGRRDAVSIFYARGETIARFAQTSHREFPVHGGVSTLAETIPLLEDIAAPAEALVREMELEGPSMVEFRRDASGRPVLMEVNPRMAGSLALALRSGVDFAALTYDWSTGRPLAPARSYRAGRRLRWITGDVWHLKCAFDSSGPDVPSRRSALARFFGDFALRPAAIDGVDIYDLRPTFVDWREQVLRPLAGRVRRRGRSRSATEEERR